MKVKKVSSQTILSQISALGISSGSGWHGEAIEYIGEAVKGIGHHVGFKKVKDLEVEVMNFTGFLPVCLESLEGVSFNGCPLVLGYDTDKICRGQQPVANYNDINTYNDVVDNIEYLKCRIQEAEESGVTDSVAMQSLNSELRKAHMLISSFGQLGRNYSHYKGDWFIVENNAIKTSFETGTVLIEGTMLDLDEEGYPYVVDTFKYSTAVYWYVLYKLLLGEYDHPKITWQSAFEMWEYYRQKAANEPNILNKVTGDRFVRMWNSIARDSRHIYRT